MAHEGDLLKTLLRIKNLTHEGFAKSLGVTRQTVVNWFEKSRLPKKRLPDIEALLNVKFSELSDKALKSQFELGLSHINPSLTPSAENNSQLSAQEKDLRIAYLEMALKAVEEKYDIAIELAEVRKQRIIDLEEKLTLRTLTHKQKQKESISEPIKKDGH